MSGDDRVLAALRDAARAEASDDLADPRWDALAAGKLSDADRQELAAKAEHEPVLSGAMELFAPFDASSQDRFLAAIRAEIGRRPGESAATTTATAGPAAAPAAPADAPTVVPLDATRRRRALAAAVAVLAVAAAVLLWARAGSDADPPLPVYAMLVTGGERDVRSEPPPPLVLSPGSRVTITLRPAESAQGPIDARAFLVQGAVEVPIAAAVEVSSEGAVRMVGRAPDASSLVAGEAELVVAVGRGKLGGASESIGVLSGRDTSLRWIRRRLEWRAQ